MADTISVLTGGSNNFSTTAEHLNAVATDILSDGVVGAITNTSGVAPSTGALACNAQGTPDMTVAVTAGKCYITATPTSQNSQRLRANIAAQNATIASNSSGATRYDWIYVKVDAAKAAAPNVSGTDVVSVVVSRSTSSTTDDGTPPTYGILLAVVTVSNGASSITNGNIADRRSIAGFTPGTGSDGWISIGATCTYSSAAAFTLSGDYTNVIAKGDKIKLTQTTVKYFSVSSIVYSTGTTTVNITGGTDYTLANASITSPYYSHSVSPVGHPGWFAYTPTWTGFSSNPTGFYRFKIDGTRCVVTHRSTSAGTSNSTSFTATAPVISKTLGASAAWGTTLHNLVDNSSAPTAGGSCNIGNGVTTITMYKNAGYQGAWTGSNGKAADFTLEYEI